MNSSRTKTTLTSTITIFLILLLVEFGSTQSQAASPNPIDASAVESIKLLQNTEGLPLSVKTYVKSLLLAVDLLPKAENQVVQAATRIQLLCSRSLTTNDFGIVAYSDTTTNSLVEQTDQLKDACKNPKDLVSFRKALATVTNRFAEGGFRTAVFKQIKISEPFYNAMKTKNFVFPAEDPLHIIQSQTEGDGSHSPGNPT